MTLHDKEKGEKSGFGGEIKITTKINKKGKVIAHCQPPTQEKTMEWEWESDFRFELDSVIENMEGYSGKKSYEDELFERLLHWGKLFISHVLASSQDSFRRKVEEAIKELYYSDDKDYKDYNDVIKDVLAKLKTLK